MLNVVPPGAGLNLDCTPDILCLFPHAAQTMPIVIADGIKSPAIVRNS